MSDFFDKFEDYFIPYMVLKSPNGEELDILHGCYNRRANIVFNGMSEISFTAPRYIDGEETRYFSRLEGRRYLHVENVGDFIITDVRETSDGLTATKEVEAKSIAFEFTMKDILKLDKVMTIYNPSEPEKSIMHFILGKVRGWTMGSISPGLINMYRRMDVSNTSLYNFMIKDVQDAFQCIFIFDIMERKVHVKSFDDVIRETNIYLSHDNLIQNVDVRQVTDEIVTALNVTGRDRLSINQVNPLGTDMIYDFSYYMKGGRWMTPSLVTAIIAWQQKIESYHESYSEFLTILRTKYLELGELKSELAELETIVLQAEDALKVAIEAGHPTDDLAEALRIAEENAENKRNEVSAMETTIQNVINALKTINNAVSFSTNFTNTQLDELDKFIYVSSYNNKNFLITDIMEPHEIQDQAQALLEQATAVLDRVSKPLYEFTIKSDNFLFMKEFEPFISELSVGGQITIDMDGYFVYPVLLGVNINYDDPKDFELIFSNRLRLGSKEVQFSELISEMKETSSKVSLNSDDWDDWNVTGESAVKAYLRDALADATRRILSSKDQEITIGANGILGRQRVGTSTPPTYADEQLWITSNVIGFTSDAWQTTKTAIGKILRPGWEPSSGQPTPSPSDYHYGIATEVLVGNLLIGESLLIQNENSTFKVNATGAVLKNANFTINTTKRRITLSGAQSENAFLVEANKSGTWNKVLWIDDAGDLNTVGKIKATSGEFTGKIVATEGNIGSIVIESPVGNTNAGIRSGEGSNPDWYIRPNEVKIGGMVWNKSTGSTTFSGHLSGATGSFSGTVQADKLIGQVDWSQIVNAPVPADRFNSGSGYNFSGFSGSSLPPSQVDRGAWEFAPGCSLGTYGTNGYQLSFAGTGAVVASGALWINSGSTVSLQGSPVSLISNSISMSSRPYVGQNLDANMLMRQRDGDERYARRGLTTTFTVSTPSGRRVLSFTYGVLTSSTSL